ncbi:MAG: DUF1573 domain-containing protein [bacterium]
MRNLIIFSILFSIVLTLRLTAQPKIEFEGGNTYNWGKVKPKDSPLKAKVKLWNKGTDTLIIKEVKPGCGCTTAPLDKSIIPPKKYATLDITLKIDGSSGLVNKDIKIYSNAPNSVEYYYINADVFREITTVDESYFNYGSISQGQDVTKEVRIKNNSNKPIKIRKIEDKPDYCKLNIKEGSVIPPNGILTIKATVNVHAPGYFAYCLKITTSVSKIPDLYISAWGDAK